MTTPTKQKRYPVVIQKRRILSGKEKGKIKEAVIWCKHLEDACYHRKPCIINGNHHPSYEVISTKVEIRSGPEFNDTYEEGAQ